MDLMLNYLDLPNVNEESDSDTELPIRHRAVFETTKRLLGQLINKILVRVTDIKTYGHKGFEDLVYLKPKYSSDEEDICFKLILNNTNFENRNGEMTSMIRPESILTSFGRAIDRNYCCRVLPRWVMQRCIFEPTNVDLRTISTA